MLLYNRSTGTVLATRVRLARGPLHRIVGFLTRHEIAVDEGLWFERCQAVHTIGMRATIDIVFLDRFGRVLWSEAGVRPGRAVISDHRAESVLEMGHGFLARSDVLAGDVLLIEDCEDQRPSAVRDFAVAASASSASMSSAIALDGGAPHQIEAG